MRMLVKTVLGRVQKGPMNGKGSASEGVLLLAVCGSVLTGGV